MGHFRNRKTRKSLEVTSIFWEELFLDSTRKNRQVFEVISIPSSTTTKGQIICRPMLEIRPCFKIVADQSENTKFYHAVKQCGCVWNILTTKSRVVPGLFSFPSYIILHLGFGCNAAEMTTERDFNHIISQHVYGQY